MIQTRESALCKGFSYHAKEFFTQMAGKSIRPCDLYKVRLWECNFFTVENCIVTTSQLTGFTHDITEKWRCVLFYM